ncbi:hypothetical protein CRG98_007589 [Punica granatum]|uniref:Uncharacterized protein n=1 Tax=Punica granatum TaxID=22663 RepID=A0A2I0KUM0_PUNGR|nr:hypothetical protein CRG98_007589 [Punica granatum]
MRKQSCWLRQETGRRFISTCAKVANRQGTGEFGEVPPPIGGGESGDDEEQEHSHIHVRAQPDQGPAHSREPMMDWPVVQPQLAEVPPSSPPAMFSSFCRPGEMSAIVTALTQVVSGQRAGSQGTLPHPTPSSCLPLSLPSYSPAPWVGQKRPRGEGSSSGVSEFASLRGHGMYGDLIARSQSAEPSSFPTGTLVSSLSNHLQT